MEKKKRGPKPKETITKENYMTFSSLDLFKEIEKLRAKLDGTPDVRKELNQFRKNMQKIHDLSSNKEI